MNTAEKSGDLIGRILLAAMFLLAGIQKIGGYEGTQGYMEAMGVPGALLPAVIALEIGGALAIIAGFFTRWVAAALAGFTLAAAFLFHYQPEDQMQMILFLKNISIAGAFLILVARGAGPWSLDARRH